MAERHATAACAKIKGPRTFTAVLEHHADGHLVIRGKFTGSSGVCVRSALSMGRVGAFSDADGLSVRKVPVSVTLPPLP